MKITLSRLRAIVREEVERNMRWSAGMFGGGVSNAAPPGKLVVLDPLPGLGTDVDETEKDNDERKNEEQESQPDTRGTPGQDADVRRRRRVPTWYFVQSKDK